MTQQALVHALFVALVMRTGGVMFVASCAIAVAALRLMVIEYRRPRTFRCAGEPPQLIDDPHSSFFYDVHRGIFVAALFWAWGSGSVLRDPALVTGIVPAPPLPSLYEAWSSVQDVDVVLGSVFIVGTLIGMTFFLAVRLQEYRGRHVYSEDKNGTPSR